MEVPLGAFAGVATGEGPVQDAVRAHAVHAFQGGCDEHHRLRRHRIGAGSVGMPTAMHLAEKGMKVLCLDQFASPGRADNSVPSVASAPPTPPPPRSSSALDSLKTSPPGRRSTAGISNGPRAATPSWPTQAERLLGTSWWDREKQAGLNRDWLDRLRKLLKVAPGLRTEGPSAAPFPPRTVRPPPCAAAWASTAARWNWAWSAASTSGSPHHAAQGQGRGRAHRPGQHPAPASSTPPAPGRGPWPTRAAWTRRWSRSGP